MSNNPCNLVSHGWQALFYDPEIFPDSKFKQYRDYIKGPFEKVNLVHMFPCVILPQQNSSRTFREGIPEYSIRKLIIPSYDSMHKEDVDIVHDLRKKYRLNYGQGIPDPWTSHPFLENSDFISCKDLKSKIGRPKSYLSNARISKDYFKKDSCLCCEKKYLFECPDKTVGKNRSALNCTCKECHGGNEVGDNENCKIIKSFHGWVSENTEQKEQGAGRETSGTSPFSPRHQLPNTPEYLKRGNNCRLYCESQRRSRNKSGGRGDAESSTSENQEFIAKDDRKVTQRKDVYFCPYIKNFVMKKSLSKNCRKNSKTERKKPRGRVSKEIQTEIQPIRDSKAVQTEKKSQCKPEDVHCNLNYGRVQMFSKGQHFPKIFCPYSFYPHPCFLYPCYCAASFKVPKSDKETCPECCCKNRKKEQQKKETEDKLNVDWNHQTKANQGNTSLKGIMREKYQDFQPKHNEDNLNHKTSPKTFDQLRYMSKNSKNYLPRAQSILYPEYRPAFMPSKSFYKAEPSWKSFEADKFRLTQFEPFKQASKEYSECVPIESRLVTQGKLDQDLRPYSGGELKISPETTKNKTEVPTKVKFFKEIIDSDESRTFGLVRNNEEDVKGIRKRKRFLVNRKKRRKLVGAHIFSNMPPRPPMLIDKTTQVDFKREDSMVDNPKNVSPLNKRLSFPESQLRSPRFINFRQGNEVRFNPLSNNTVLGVKEKEIPNKQPGIYPARQSGRCDILFSGVFDKISQGSGTTWSSNTLKSLVDELLIEKNRKKPLDGHESLK